jgi:glycosyltransferase involved in cell wall biosynthesis
LAVVGFGDSAVKASLLMTVYNCQTYVRSSVASALSQVAAEFEVVVINDGSTDLTSTILDEIADPRLKVVHCERMGRPRALNFGVARCTAPYVAILDADDVALPHRLHQQVAYLDSHADVALVGSRYRPHIDQHGNPITEDVFPLRSDEIARELSQFRCPMFHSSVMFRKQQVCDAGGYDEGLTANEDWDLYVRLALAARLPIANIDERLSLKRLHAKQFFWGRGGARWSPAGELSDVVLKRRIADLLAGR